ncbi:MAG: TGS domain-containing protein, partial [Thermaerobacterales bacterium]
MSHSVEIRLPDGSVREIQRGTRVEDIVKDIGPGLARSAIAAAINGRVVELFHPLDEGGDFKVLTFDTEDGRYCYRHTAAHVLAQAVKRLFPEVRLAIGPPIDDGFYYDIEAARPLTPEDLEQIELEMARIIKEDLPLERFELSREEALQLMRDQGEKYKEELIEDLPAGEAISFYRQGEFVDLCRGPHAPRTGRLKHLKLLNVAGAYWRGDETRPMLQRIYGTAFDKKEDLAQFLWRRAEARKRDHRRLGPELDLFHLDDVSPGNVFWHPKGTVLYNQLVSFSRDLQGPRNYQEVRTPDILKVDLWQQSGHWEFFRDNMFLVDQEGQMFAVKPLNCPGHA